jgi:Holliday junction resolvase RusA-like endonuclease
MEKDNPFPVKIILPFVTPSVNKLLRMHYFARKREQDKYKKWLAAAFGEYTLGAVDRRFNAEKEKRHLEIRSFRKRRIDPDNLIGGMKLLIDALCDVGLLWDDSPRYLDLTVIQETDGKNPRTEVSIFEETK